MQNSNPPSPDPDQAPDPRFAVDCMLGTLAKWLKILGYDALYARKIEDAELVEQARAEGRVLLTRDRRMTERRRARPFLLIESERSLDQLREVVEALGLELREDRLLTRCLPCNVATREIDQAEVETRVPSYVFETQSRFRQCPSCSRIYWGATHRSGMLERLREVFRVR
jgi:hypothetical protein